MPVPDNAGWEPLLNRVVVVDTDSDFLYIGTLARVDDHFVVLEEVDVHDRRETPTTKELYIMQVRKHGVKPNRKRVAVRKATVVSASLLDDVIMY